MNMYLGSLKSNECTMYRVVVNKQLNEIKLNQQDLGRQTMIENQKAEDFRTSQKLVSLKDRLMAGDRMASAWANNQDTYEKACKDHHGGTCKWLFDRNEFRNWIADDSARPILWLNGKHGAGKTVLCAAAIKHLAPNKSLPHMETDATNFSPSKPSPIVVRQFLSKDAYIPQRQLLRITATQLMDSLVKMDLDSIPNSILPFLNITNDDSTILESLILAILLELPLTYIFIDGLDDAEYADIPMSTPTPHPPADVKLFVEFLIKEASNNPAKVRLWLSSQPLPDIRQYVCNPELSGPDRIGEIRLTTNDTHDDIMSYLSHYIPSSTKDKSDLAKVIVRGALKTEVEGSFLWASEMVNDIKDETENEDDIIDLVKEGLPLEMGKLYEKVIRRIIDNDKKPKRPPLWKVILSLLAFAKRPLKMSEVIEAIAILRTSSGNNMRKDIVSEEKILKCCLSLVWHAPRILDGRNVGLVRLSHSAVRAFLLNKSDSKIDSVSKNLPLVENWIIRDCCLQYLNQPRYGALLEKRSSTEFRTLDGVSVLARQFLLYAAKYWFQHFDSPDESNDTVPADCDATAVRVFLRSPNFRTTMQIQSLFITGHFLQSFDSITDRGLSVRRTLPNWMQKHEPELHRQYQAFQGEWSRLLQSKRSDSFRGEISRCFWGALGSENFLSSDAHILGRYDSFEFGKGKESRREGDSCQVHHISQDGQRLVTGWVRAQENQKQICVEMWTLDGKSHPRAKPMTTMPFSATDTSMAFYTLPCSQSFYSIPLIPRVDSVVPPDAIALRLDGSIIRLGSKIFRKETTDSLSYSTGFSELTGKSFGDSWEEVCIRDPFLVVCRRRIYRKRLGTTDEEREGQRVHQLRRRMSVHERSRSRSRTRSVSPLPPFLEDSSSLQHLPRQIRNKVIEDGFSVSFDFRVADSDDQSSGYISNSETNSTSSRRLSDLPSAEESWSEGMSSANDSSSDEIASQEPEESEDDDIGDGLDVRSQHSEDDDSDIKSVLSAKSGNSQATNGSGSLASLSLSQILSNSSSESGDDEIQSDLSEDETLHAEPAVANPEPEGPVVIGKSNGRVECDSCGKRRLRTWYHCIICNDANFNLCDRCERRGVWCLDISHQLYKIINRKPSGVVSRRSFDVRQQLTVYRTDVPGEKPAAFHFRKKYSIMLYDSPPVVHQKHPLVIWALSDSRLLFADLTHNQFFEQKIAAVPGAKKAHPICVSLSFSPCGKFLRMAIIDVIAEKPKPTIGSMANPASASKARLCLNLHVLVLQLSSSQPARNRPKLLASTSCRLGCSCARAFVPTLPFAFTWGASDLYLTLSDSSLRVYRVLLPGIDAQSSETGSVDQVNKAEFKFTIKVPKEIILLPRSSRNRSVQFFPARTRDTKATVIIGPRYGQNPAPPIGVYLGEKDLGCWTDLDEMGDREGNVYSSQKTLGAQFEEPWDENKDCILIPFDGY